MKKYIYLLGILGLLCMNNTYSYEYLENIGGYNGKVFKIEKNSPYKIVVATTENGESLKELVEKEGGIAGVNGAYFCPKDYPKCNGKNFSDFDRISNGKISSKWKNTGVRYIFGFDKNNKPLIHKSPNIQKDSFEGIYNGISNFPLILKNGKSQLNSYGDLIDTKMKAKGPKNFICSTTKGNIYMGYLSNMTIYDMVTALKNIGCNNALNLDSGGSLSVYNRGYERGPGRDIMDAFVIVEDTKKILKLNKQITLINKKVDSILQRSKNKTLLKIQLKNRLNNYLKRNLNFNTKYMIKGILDSI